MYCNNNIGAGNITSTDDQYLRIEWCDNVTDVPTKDTFLSKIKEITDKESDTSTKLDAEIDRAKTAEQNITDNLNTEIAERKHDDEQLQSQINTIIAKQETQQDKVITRTLSENTVTETFDAPNDEHVLVLQDESKTGSIKFDKDNEEVTIKSNNSLHLDANKISQNTCEALSDKTIALGYNTLAGGKGFKITSATKIDDTTGIYTLTSVTGLEVGMEYNVRLTFAKYKCGKILSISGTTITVDGYPNIALSTKQDTDYDKNNYLTIIDRPDLGDIDVGFFTAAFGENCIAQVRSGFVAGRLNTVVGEYGVALGRENTVGCAGFVAGRENTVLGDMSLTAGQANTATGNVSSALGRQNTVSGTASFVQGFKNTVSGIYSSAFGIQNEVSGNQSIAIGYNNKDLSDSSFVGGASSKVLQGHNVSLVFGTSLLSGAPRQTIFGTFNDSTSSAKFIFGNGTSESNRKNAFEIFEDGTASLQSQGTLDNSITIKKYVDTKVPQNNTPSAYDRVYTTSKKGVQGVLAYSPSAIAGTLAARGANGVLDVGTPTKDTNATTKKYVDDLVSAQVSSVYKAKGSIADISALPTPDKTHEGFVYNIESAFTTTAQFVEGAGKSYPAGTNVVIVNTSGTTYKYDVLAGMVDLSGYAKNDTVNNKVDKVSTTSSYDRAYIVNRNGIQEVLAISPNLVGNTIAARQKDGQISVGTPTSTDHATPKGYVDDKIAELQAQIENIQTVLSSLFEGNAVTTQETSQNEIPMVVDDPSNDTNTEVAEEQVAEEEKSVE